MCPLTQIGNRRSNLGTPPARQLRRTQSTLPLSKMTPEDIALIEAEYERVHAATKSVLLSNSYPDCDAHQTELNTTISAIEGLEKHFDGLVKHYSHLRDVAAVQRRTLERDFENTKRAYWNLRKEADRSIPKNQQ